ncbi:hypothetical protein NLJ89_g2712 [Agrocybe chaxingu]|uniref:Major facilitator superfamily (MFS) profile domain-containing protein n=1 Tax=Agrocybe chaxingu TaxID=84603 RepID=A0A9W8MXG2_9AGAR|nr:hypothetical protein NLJ89_g2712 [Agrocybe chaxingu]
MSERDPLIQHEHDDKHDSRPGPLEISRSTRYGILAGLWTGTVLSALNQTLVPTIESASWLGTSYLLATCTFTPLYGRLCNVMGRKRANQTALLFAGLGVFMCGMSKSMEMLIVARFLSGIGGGGLFTTSSIIVSDMYSIRSRGLTQGVASVFNGLGLGLGGPFGGLITDWLGWRWAFLIQLPLFGVSYLLTSWNLNYKTEGTGKSTKEILKRIDYLGSGSLMMAVGSTLIFLSVRYNEMLPWSNPAVIASLVFAVVFAFTFLFVEFFVAKEPVLAPFLIRQKIPVLVGISNFLVATCNFSVMYFFPMWFQTVMLTNASTAGLHLLPNSMSMSIGSVFAGWMMHKTGRYKTINLIFGAFPFIGASFIYLLGEDSGFFQSWFSIIPLGFGNAVVLQTVLIALLVHVPDDCMAVATGFGQLFRGVGQVGGVAVSSAIFQSNLDAELRKRIHSPDAEDLIKRIRQSARLVGSLEPELRRKAQDSYSASLKRVFFFAACSTMLAYLVRLPIPDKVLDHHHHHPQRKREPSDAQRDVEEPSASTSQTQTPVDTPFESDDEAEDAVDARSRESLAPPKPPRRRLSTYEGAEDILSDLETNKTQNTGRYRR